MPFLTGFTTPASQLYFSQHAQRDSLVSTLSWRYEEDGEDDDENGGTQPRSPRSPRLLGGDRAQARRSRAERKSSGGGGGGDGKAPPALRRLDSAPLNRRAFAGTWKIETQTNRDALLQAVDMPFLLRKAVQLVEPPNQTLFFDDKGVLHCHTGPLLQQYMEERFEEGPCVCQPRMISDRPSP